MFLSVSMPVYNAEKYLDQCISSVMSQTEKDFELLLVDDGSRDRSLEICRSWQTKYPDKIRVIEKKNSGSLFTRRICMAESRGDYIYIMDADDYLTDDHMFCKLRQELEKDPVDMIIFSHTRSEIPGKEIVNYGFTGKKRMEGQQLQQLYKEIFTGDSLNALWNKVFRRELMDLNEDYSTYTMVTNGTDIFQLLPILNKAESVLYLPDVFYFYRVEENASSIIHKFRPTVHESLKQIFLRMQKYARLWEQNPGQYEEILRLRYMKMTTTSAYKVRLAPKDGSVDRREYLRKIGEDPLFKEEFTLKGLPHSRQIIVLLFEQNAMGAYF